MKRIVVAMMAAAGLAAGAGSAVADPGGFSPPTRGAGMTFPAAGGMDGGPSALNPDYGAPPPPGRYGLNPWLKRLAFWRKDCDDCDPGHPGLFGGKKAKGAAALPPGPVTPYAPATQGTLVFPNHPFVRSPRDYFMEDPRR